jgi:hypothetical protein
LLWSLEKPNFEQALEALRINQISPATADEEDAVYEGLWEFYQYPLNLNKASQEDLELFGILTETQIQHFFAHITQNGPLVSIYELQAIPEFTLKTIHLLLPFVQVSEFYPQYPTELKKLGLQGAALGYWLVRYERVLETKEGYKLNLKKSDIPYVGSPDKLITRFQYSYPNKWRFGFSSAKHAGEAFTWDFTTTRYGFSVYNAYCLLENTGYFKQILLGDYQIGYGQGLIVNAGFSLDKSSDAIPSIRTNNAGIKPYVSSNTDRLSGLAATLSWKHFVQTIYYAYNRLDARVQTNLNTNQKYITGISRTSLHRTQTELGKKDRAIEQVLGITWIYQHKEKGVELGLNALYNTFNLPIDPVYANPNSFRGRQNYNIGLFYRYLWHNLHFFGESAICQGNGKAIIIGVVASLSKNLDTSLLIRHYSPDFHNHHGKAFRKNPQGNNNEQGIYIGCSLQITKKFRLATYYDYFRFPAPSQAIPQASAGYDWLVKITYQPQKQSLWILQYLEKDKAQKVPHTLLSNQKEKIPVVNKSKNRRLKAQCKHSFNRNLAITTEMQGSGYQFIAKPAWGYGLMQKATYRQRKWDITGQIAWFDTAHNNKIYFQEKDVLYSRNRPTAYYHQGIKYYFLLAYKPITTWRLEVKYACTRLINQTSMGSGLENIQGNSKNEIKLQIIYRF